LHSELGDIFNEMGDDAAAMSHLQRAVSGFAALGLADSRAGLEALFRRGTVYLDQSQWELARADLTRCIARGLAVYGPGHRWAVGAREKLAFIHLEKGEAQAAIAVAREALAAPLGEDLENDALRRLRVKVIIGEAQTNLGDFRGARETLTQAVTESAGPAGHSLVDRLVYRLLLVRAIFYSGDIVGAEPAAAELARDEERVLGKSHPLVFPARQLWANSLAALGHYDAAIDTQRETLKLAEAMTDEERVAVQRSSLSLHLLHAARYREAEPLAREADEFFHRSSPLGPRAPPARRVLAEVLLGEGRQAEAQREIDQALAEARNIDAFTRLPEWADLLDSASNVRRMAGDYAAAADLREQACALLDKSPGASTPRALRCATERAWLRAMQVPHDDAAAAAFSQAADSYAAALPAQQVARLDMVLLGAELDIAAGRPARTDLAATRAAWRLALGVAPPTRITFLH
jgi:tetratricopeptide (TPR) repeat protein